MSRDDLGFIHRYVPATPGTGGASSVTLLLLHGTGGDETDLVPLGTSLLPGTAILSPRGKVLEGNAPRFFRRIAEGVLDQEDLAQRTEELARFIESAVQTYQLDGDNVYAIGFSNGANIAGSLLLRRPGLLRGAVLLSPMIPFEPDPLPDLTGTTVFIGAGKTDGISLPDQADRLAALFRQSGAGVTLYWHPGGHTISNSELEAARRWLADQLRTMETRRARRSRGALG